MLLRTHKNIFNAQNIYMNGNSGRMVIDDVLNGAISANEFTGALQKISVDPDEVARFHAQFVGDEK